MSNLTGDSYYEELYNGDTDSINKDGSDYGDEER